MGEAKSGVFLVNEIQKREQGKERPMAKLGISAKEARVDIHSGMSGDDLRKKYGLSPKGLESFLTQLRDRGLIAQDQFDRLTSSIDITVTARQIKPKIRINAQEAVGDIRGGMSDEELTHKYGLDEKRLQRLFTKLVRGGFIEQKELDRRTPSATAPPTRLISAVRSSGGKTKESRKVQTQKLEDTRVTSTAATPEPESASQIEDDAEVEAAKPSVQKADHPRAKGTYFFWLLGALIGGVIVGSIFFIAGHASSIESGLLYGLILSVAWILGSDTKGEQNYKRLNVFIIIAFGAPLFYLLTTGNWWIGPKPKVGGRPMDLGESFVTIILVYVMMFVLGACSLGLAQLWNMLRQKKV